MTATDERWMDRALGLAKIGLGSTRPNPSVGAVLVRGDQGLGEGFSAPAGGSHAEPKAIQSAEEAGHDPRGSTLYVTLEPCCHHGKTPPCTDAIRAAGIKRVVVGIIDPFPAMNGQSLELLRATGIEVVVGVKAYECARLTLGFRRSMAVGLPEVTCKVAMSLDGKIATIEGKSAWITGEQAREHAHQLRAAHDALLVGIGTVLADNPRLTVRLPDTSSQPVPVVIDANLRIPEGAAVFSHPSRPILICSASAPHRELPADIVRVADSSGGISMEAALRAIAARGLHRVLVEGGAKIHRSLFDARLVDAIMVYIAPKLIPGGLPWVGGDPVADLDGFDLVGPPTVELLGSDVLLGYAAPHAWPMEA